MDESPSIPTGYFARVPLKKPVLRGEHKIDSLLLREFTASSLMDVSLFELMRMDGTQIVKILPRISEPPLINHEVLQLHAGDILEVGQEISAFLLI